MSNAISNIQIIFKTTKAQTSPSPKSVIKICKCGRWLFAAPLAADPVFWGIIVNILSLYTAERVRVTPASLIPTWPRTHWHTLHL